MTLSLKITALATTMAADIKDLYTKYVNLTNNRVIYLPTLQINVTQQTSTLLVNYTPGMLRVHQSGVLLRSGVDYTATNGTQIVFAAPLEVGTEIDIDRISVDSGDQPSLNEIFDRTGSLQNLVTTDKTNLVAAINEIKAAGGGGAVPNDIWNVVNARASAPTTVASIGSNIPGAPTAVNYTVGDLRVDLTTGDIYQLQGSGVFSMLSAFADNSERMVRVVYGTTLPTAGAPALWFFKKAQGVLTTVSVPTSSANLPHLDTASGSNQIYMVGDIIGQFSTLTTTNKTNFVSAINEINALALLNSQTAGVKGFREHYTADVVGNYIASMVVTLGAQKPGAPTGNVWAINDVIFATAGAENGTVFRVSTGGALVVVAARNAAVNGSTIFERIVRYRYGGQFTWTYDGTTGVLINGFSPGASTDIWHTGPSGVVTLSNYLAVIGDPNALQTTAKDTLVNAINELKTGLSTAGIATELWTVQNSRGTALTAAVTIGADIPGAPTGTPYTSGNFRLDTTTGDIYILDGAGNFTLSSAMPNNTVRIVNTLYGVGSVASSNAGIRIYRKLSNVLTTISTTNNSTSGITHVNVGETQSVALNTVIGSLNSLSTLQKSSLVTAINEVKTSVDSLNLSPLSLWTVQNATTTAPTTAVTIGNQIPGAPTGVNYAANNLRLDTTTGDIYAVQAGGTVTLQSAMPDNSERIVHTQYGAGTASAASAGTRVYKKTAGVLTLVSAPSISSEVVYHSNVAGGVGVLLSAVIGNLTSLTTTAKNSFVAAINELKADLTAATIPNTLWTAVNAVSTTPTTAVTIGAQVPGAPTGVNYAVGDYRLHTTTGDIYIVQVGGTVALFSAVADNTERTVNTLYGTGAASSMTAGARFYKRVSGATTSLVVPTVSSNGVLHQDTGTALSTDLATVIGSLSTLTTTSKTSLVSAINEVRAGAGGSSITTDVINVVNARTSAPTTAVTIGGQIPGATTGINYAIGDLRLDTTTGDIYIVQTGGVVALSSAMPDNSERKVNVLYGTGAATSMGAGLRVYKKASNVLTAITVPALTTSNIIHVASGGTVGLNLQSTLGDLSTLTTTNKTNFVTVINEVITNKGIGTNTDTSTTTGATNPVLQFTTQRYNPTVNVTGVIRYGGIRKYEYLSNFSNTTGRIASGLDWYSHIGTGVIGTAVAHEARLSAGISGTITTMIGSESILSDNLSIINTLYLNRSSIESNGSIINSAKGYAVDKIQSVGSITDLVGFEFGNLSSLGGTRRLSFNNLDPGARIVSAAPIIDQSITTFAPSSNGFNINIDAAIQYVRINPTAVYNSLFINTPTLDVINGQMLYITTTKEVKKVTWYAGEIGMSIINAPTSLDEGQTVVFKYHAAQAQWICMSVVGTGVQKANKAPVLDELLIYYGYPIAYKGINSTAGVIAAIASRYKYWIVGDTYGDPLHESYANTLDIISGVRALGVIVYGYVPIGLSTSALTIAQIRVKIDQWANIGIDGIFLDEFGFDYANTRTRQIDCVNYVYGKGLPYCANAWTVEDFCYDNISQIPFPPGDWRYNNFATYNPTNLVLPRNPTDSYLFENFAFSNTGVSVIWDTQERAINVKNLSISRNFLVWAEAVFGETVPGTLDTTKLGDFTSLDEAGAYVSANAYIYGFDVVGGGGFSFGSNGTPIEMPLFALPESASAASGAQSTNFTTMEGFRYFGDVLVKVINTATDQRVIITSVTSKVLEGTYPNAAVDEITVSTTAPTNPKINQLWLDIS